MFLKSDRISIIVKEKIQKTKVKREAFFLNKPQLSVTYLIFSTFKWENSEVTNYKDV